MDEFGLVPYLELILLNPYLIRHFKTSLTTASFSKIATLLTEVGTSFPFSSLRPSCQNTSHPFSGLIGPTFALFSMSMPMNPVLRAFIDVRGPV